MYKQYAYHNMNATIIMIIYMHFSIPIYTFTPVGHHADVQHIKQQHWVCALSGQSVQVYSCTCTIYCILYVQVYSRATLFIWTTLMCGSLSMKPISYNTMCILAMCTKIICSYTAQSFRKTSQCQLPTFPTLTSEYIAPQFDIYACNKSCVPNSHADKCYNNIIISLQSLQGWLSRPVIGMIGQ